MEYLKFSRTSKKISRLILAITGWIAALCFASFPPLPANAAPIFPTVQFSKLIALQTSSETVPNTPPTSFVTAAVNRIGPAVVRIDTERTISRRIEPFFNDPFFQRFFGDDLFQQIPRTEVLRGQGSGFIIDPNGIILTNAHVVDKADKVTVSLNDGRQYIGEVKGKDTVTDLAVVKIDAGGQNLPVASLGNSDKVQVGDWAIAVGNPLGFNNTVTLGIVSTLKRPSSAVGIPDKRLDFIQTDAAINPGNSGGPLLNDRGEVIGINTAIRPDATGIGFAIPINKAKEIKDILASGGKVPHPFVGIQMVTLTPEMARENNSDPNTTLILPEVKGVLVTRVLANTPAEKGGIRRGDVIVEIDSQEIISAEQLQRKVEESGVGKRLQFKVIRNGKTTPLFVVTEEMNTP